MVKKNRVDTFISDRFGSRRGGVKFIKFWFLDAVFGRYRKYARVPLKVERVIFVCKGNICRSAYAEYIFKSINETPSCSIGLDTQTGHPANTRVLKAAEKRGLSLSLHRTTSVTDFRSNTGDLFVCVEPKHAEEVEQRFGGACSVMLLGALCGPGHVYIHDPYSAGDDYLNSCLDLIDAAVRKLSLLIGEKVKM